MNLRSLIPGGDRTNLMGDRTNLMRPEASVFGTLQREVDRLFDEFSRGFGPLSTQVNQNLMPRVDMTENDKEIEIAVELPGLERKDVDISLDNDILTIRGEKKFEAEKDDKNKNYHLNECSYGVFYRVLQLPPGIDPATVQATMSKGVLTIKIPKPRQSEAKKIEVKDAA
jgi:HSP20 family protein